jgi:hypothetical protein
MSPVDIERFNVRERVCPHRSKRAFKSEAKDHAPV